MPDTCQRLAGKDGKQCCIYLPITQSLALLKSSLSVRTKRVTRGTCLTNASCQPFYNWLVWCFQCCMNCTHYRGSIQYVALVTAKQVGCQLKNHWFIIQINAYNNCVGTVAASSLVFLQEHSACFATLPSMHLILPSDWKSIGTQTGFHLQGVP